MTQSFGRLAALLMGALLLLAVPVYASYGGGSGGGRGDDRDNCNSSRDGGDHRGRDLDVIGVTEGGRLICFESDDPRDAEKIGTIRGLTGDTRLVGIDYRPATGNDGSRGVLYGLGDQGGVYTIDDGTAQATKASQLSVALTGQSFGVDFNPTVDRLRIISDAGQNLRANVDTGATLVDTSLTYPGPPVVPGTGVTGAAYTNNDADPNTATTLFDIDSALDQTVIQSPANSGQLAATGKLGVDTNATIGSDIYSTIRNGTTVDVAGFASLTVGGRSAFYEIDLLQGRATSNGVFSSRNQVTGIAIPLNQL